MLNKKLLSPKQGVYIINLKNVDKCYFLIQICETKIYHSIYSM